MEEISEAIHQKRLEMRNQAELGIRGAGVGSESPSPPPMRGKVHVSIDGKKTHLASSCSTGNSLTTVTSAQFSVSNTTGQDFVPSSVIYSSPEKARSESYRKAIDARHSVPNDLDNISEDYSVNVEDEYLALPKSSPRADHSEDVEDVFTKSEDRLSAQSGESTPLSTSPGSKGKKSAKLKGLILIPVGAGQDPLQANLRITTKPHVARSRTEPIRPASYPYSHNTDNQKEVPSMPCSSKKMEEEDKLSDIKSPGSDTSGTRLLRVPSSQDFDEGSISDTESITSGQMLDDDQIEFLTMDFTACKLDSVEENSEPQVFRRLSLQPTLSEINNLVRRQSSHEKSTVENNDDLGDMNDVTLTSGDNDEIKESVSNETIPSEQK